MLVVRHHAPCDVRMEDMPKVAGMNRIADHVRLERRAQPQGPGVQRLRGPVDDLITDRLPLEKSVEGVQAVIGGTAITVTSEP